MAFNVPRNDLETIIFGDEVPSAEKIVEVAKPLGEYLNNQKLTTTQIRGVFGTVRRIEMGWRHAPQKARRDFILLQPKLEYQGKRHDPVERLARVMVQAIQLASDDSHHNPHNLSPQQRFQRFADFFEAVLAYHIAAGGK